MFKVIWLLRRKEGITFEQFREHYETSHSVIGQKYFGHLIIDYKRNYNRLLENGGAPVGHVSDWDCITEWIMPNQEALEETGRLLKDPVIGAIFDEDEEKFLMEGGSRMHICDMRDTGPGDGAETLKIFAEREKAAH